MNTNISINVANKIASVIGSPAIICGNSDYIINFTFDEEWETFSFKTARFIYKEGDTLRFIDIAFTGSTVAVPILSKVEEVYVGVYAGDLHTTTPTRILCKKSILCDDPEQHVDPPEDVYAQLIELINNLDTLLPPVGINEAGKALMVNENGRWVVRRPDFMHDQNTNKLIRFFFGTNDEWENWDGDKQDVLFVPTDVDIIQDLLDKMKALEERMTIKHEGVLIWESDTAVTELELTDGKTFQDGKKYKFVCDDGFEFVVYKKGIYDSRVLNTVTEGYMNDKFVKMYCLCPEFNGDTEVKLYGVYVHLEGSEENFTAVYQETFGCYKIYELT